MVHGARWCRSSGLDKGLRWTQKGDQPIDRSFHLRASTSTVTRAAAVGVPLLSSLFSRRATGAISSSSLAHARRSPTRSRAQSARRARAPSRRRRRARGPLGALRRRRGRRRARGRGRRRILQSNFSFERPSAMAVCRGMSNPHPKYLGGHTGRTYHFRDLCAAAMRMLPAAALNRHLQLPSLPTTPLRSCATTPPPHARTGARSKRRTIRPRHRRRRWCAARWPTPRRHSDNVVHSDWSS